MDEEKAILRTESDSIGEKEVPEDAYYGVQSLRAAENFHITGLKMHPELIRSLAFIKKAAAMANHKVGLLDDNITRAIIVACDEIILGNTGWRRNLHQYECERSYSKPRNRAAWRQEGRLLRCTSE